MDPRLEALLDQYQDQLDEGRTPSVAELCRDCPDLRAEFERQVARLHRVGRLLGDPTPPVVPPGADAPGSPAEEPALLSLSDDKTWVGQNGSYVRPVEIPAPPGYEVIAPLGEGGMGVVYKARQVGLNRLCALKMILGGARARGVDLVRFRDEAQAIAALRHPHIVQVYETGEFRDQPFFSLEFCAGGTLAKALHGEPQPARTAAGIVEVLARAVHYAHTRGIIHRDLKPSNVLLSSRFQVPSSKSTIPGPEAIPDRLPPNLELETWNLELKITDFGLAKRVDDDSARTQDGSVIGTPAYMAPEQALGATRDVSPATDVHALGAILYELLTGRPPFKGSTVHETLEQVRHRDPVRVRELQPKVPVDVETICLKCLQKDPKKRYSSAEALADDLRRFLDGKSIVARPVGHVRRAWRWARRDPRTAGLVAAIVLMAIALPGVLAGYSIRLHDVESALDRERRAAAVAVGAGRRARAEQETHYYYAALGEARQLRAEGRPGWTWAALDRLAEAAATDTPDRDPEALRTELAAARGAVDLRPVGSLADGLQAGAVAFAPDGRVAVAPQLVPPVAEVRYVLVHDPRTGAERRLPFPGGLGLGVDATTALAFSPDGRWLVLGLRGGDVFCWDLDAEPDPARTRWTAHKGGVTAVAFAPDSKWLFTGGQDGRVKRWPINGPAKEDRTWPAAGNPKGKVGGLAYWDGPRAGLLVHGPNGSRLLDPATLTELGPARVDGVEWVAPAVGGSYGRFAVHPATGTIAVVHGGRLEVAYWERGICEPVASLRDPQSEDGAAHPGWIEDLAFHPSGMLLATVCPSGGRVKVWHLGTGELAVSVPVANARAVAFSPDGRTLAVCGDHTTARYEVGGLSARTFLGRRGLPIRAVGLTADGKVGTVAVRKRADNADRGSAIASVWDEDGRLVDTLLHRADGPLRGGQCGVAACPVAGLTAFHAGDGAVVWRTGTVPGPVEGPAKDGLRDLAVAPDGRCWLIEGSKDLRVRPAGSDGKAKPVPVGMPWNGRPGLTCVRAGKEHVLVGCENGFLRVVRADGAVVRSAACFDETPAMLLAESANTVHAVALSADNTLAAAGTEDGRLWLFRLPGEKVGGWPAHEDRVTAVAFDPTGEWLASGGRDRRVRLWRRAGDGYASYVTLNSPGAGPVAQVLFAAGGRRLVVLHERETAVRVWHLDRLSAAFAEAKVGR